MIFQKRGLNVNSRSGNALGSTVQFELGQEFPILAILLIVTLTPTAVMATQNGDGILNIVKRLKLSVQDGGQNRNVVDATGAGLIEYARQVNSFMSANTAAAINVNSTAARTIVYPIFCSLPNVSDPVSPSLALPVHRYDQKPILEVQLASQAEMDTNGTPTFAVSAGVTLTVAVQRAFVNIRDFPFINWELVENSVTFSGNQTQARTRLPVPGAITGLLLRGYPTSASRGDVTSNANLSVNIAGSDIFQTRWRDLAEWNELSLPTLSTNFGNVTLPDRASVFFDFLSDESGHTLDFGSVLNVNGLAGSGVAAELVHDFAYTNTTTKLNLLYHRILGDIRPFIAGRRSA
jgi:hypothetical protein